MTPKKDKEHFAAPEPRYKAMRSYIASATKAAIHPVRAQLLKALKEGEKSTVDLEQLTGEARYNLYHHLNALEEVGLIGWTMRDSKTKLFALKTPEAPQAAVVVLDHNDIEQNRQRFNKVMDLLSDIEGERIPNRENVVRAEICLYYDNQEGRSRKT